MSDTFVIQDPQSVTFVAEDGDTTIVRDAGDGDTIIVDERGSQGPPSRQDMAPFFQGPLAAQELLYRVKLAGQVTFDVAHSSAEAIRGATSIAVISICRNATYANALAPTSLEIAAALWATITFAGGGQAGPQTATVAYVGTNPGRGAAGDVLDWWSAANADPTLASVSATLAGP